MAMMAQLIDVIINILLTTSVAVAAAPPLLTDKDEKAAPPLPPLSSVEFSFVSLETILQQVQSAFRPLCKCSLTSSSPTQSQGRADMAAHSLYFTVKQKDGQMRIVAGVVGVLNALTIAGKPTPQQQQQQQRWQHIKWTGKYGTRIRKNMIDANKTEQICWIEAVPEEKSSNGSGAATAGAALASFYPFGIHTNSTSFSIQRGRDILAVFKKTPILLYRYHNNNDNCSAAVVATKEISEYGAYIREMKNTRCNSSGSNIGRGNGNILGTAFIDHFAGIQGNMWTPLVYSTVPINRDQDPVYFVAEIIREFPFNKAKVSQQPQCGGMWQGLSSEAISNAEESKANGKMKKRSLGGAGGGCTPPTRKLMESFLFSIIQTSEEVFTWATISILMDLYPPPPVCNMDRDYWHYHDHHHSIIIGRLARSKTIEDIICFRKFMSLTRQWISTCIFPSSAIAPPLPNSSNSSSNSKISPAATASIGSEMRKYMLFSSFLTMLPKGRGGGISLTTTAAVSSSSISVAPPAKCDIVSFFFNDNSTATSNSSTSNTSANVDFEKYLIFHGYLDSQQCRATIAAAATTPPPPGETATTTTATALLLIGPQQSFDSLFSADRSGRMAPLVSLIMTTVSDFISEQKSSLSWTDSSQEEKGGGRKTGGGGSNTNIFRHVRGSSLSSIMLHECVVCMLFCQLVKAIDFFQREGGNFRGGSSVGNFRLHQQQQQQRQRFETTWLRRLVSDMDLHNLPFWISLYNRGYSSIKPSVANLLNNPSYIANTIFENLVSEKKKMVLEYANLCFNPNNVKPPILLPTSSSSGRKGRGGVVASAAAAVAGVAEVNPSKERGRLARIAKICGIAILDLTVLMPCFGNGIHREIIDFRGRSTLMNSFEMYTAFYRLFSLIVNEWFAIGCAVLDTTAAGSGAGAAVPPAVPADAAALLQFSSIFSITFVQHHQYQQHQEIKKNRIVPWFRPNPLIRYLLITHLIEEVVNGNCWSNGRALFFTPSSSAE